jgi:hypothetical protein
MTTKISGANISSIGNTGLNWQAVTVADGSTQVNATSGNGYLLDTNTGVIEVFLPTSPVRGDTVVLADYSGTFATNKVIVNTGGVLIDSTVGSEVQITTNNTIAEFVYIDSAKGWLVKLNQAAGTTPSSALTEGNIYDQDDSYITATGGTITTSGDYKVHVFTGDGCFVVSCGQGALATVDYLVVGGGGGGAAPDTNNASAGGGGGGFRLSNYYALPAPTTSPLATPTGIQVSVQTYPVTVGGGGTSQSQPSGSTPAPSGSPSVFSTITSTGGGGGGGAPGGSGQPGGSGGGASLSAGAPTPIGGAGAGNTPPVSPPQGNNGGPAGPGNPSNNYSHGGGGAGAVGSVATASCQANIAVGSYVSSSFAVGCAGSGGPICGARYFAGGGAGGATQSGAPSNAPETSTANNAGGGGKNSSFPGGAGGANMGGGGAGGHYWGHVNQSGNVGGKGIVIIRYKFQ